MREQIGDHKLPVEPAVLIKPLNEAKVPDAEEITKQFCEKQWKYRAAIFRLDADIRHGKHAIIPIIRKKIISVKGGTADLWQIEVLEEFVEEKLQEKVPHSRYEGEDGLGWVSRSYKHEGLWRLCSVRR